MKLGLKSALGLAVAHLALVVSVAFGLERTLRSLEERLSADTVRLLASEQANLVFERSVAALQFPDAESKRRLHERIEDLTMLSEVVTSLSVVDAGGRVVASEAGEDGGRFAPATQIFGNPPRSHLEVTGRRSFLRGGDYVVLVPLVETGEVAGYLRVGLHSDQIASLYDQGRSRLVALVILGLVAVAALSAFLQIQVSRRVESIAAVLDGAPPPPARRAAGDEFARLLRRASRVKGDLEDARRESERRGLQVGALARILPVGVVALSRDLDVDYASDRALELCGCADESAFRRNWQAHEADLRRAMNHEPTRPGGGRSLVLGAAPGRPVQAELHRLGGPAEDYLVLLSDPRAVEALEADARLVRQLDGLDRVYRTLAHELRAPLSAMMINLDLLHLSLSREDGPAPARHRVEVLRAELNRLSRSLSGILTQTVPEAPPQSFDLTGSLADLVALLAPQARRQAVELESRLPAEPLPVRGYPDRLRQAFLNVAVNALEAMPRGGRLTVEARRDGTQARVALCDTGPGIPADALPRLYDRDFSTKDGGSGIGLHVARALVELHGGEIRIESDLGRGTDVRVIVPLTMGGA